MRKCLHIITGYTFWHLFYPNISFLIFTAKQIPCWPVYILTTHICFLWDIKFSRPLGMWFFFGLQSTTIIFLSEAKELTYILLLGHLTVRAQKRHIFFIYQVSEGGYFNCKYPLTYKPTLKFCSLSCSLPAEEIGPRMTQSTLTDTVTSSLLA